MAEAIFHYVPLVIIGLLVANGILAVSGVLRTPRGERAADLFLTGIYHLRWLALVSWGAAIAVFALVNFHEPTTAMFRAAIKSPVFDERALASLIITYALLGGLGVLACSMIRAAEGDRSTRQRNLLSLLLVCAGPAIWGSGGMLFALFLGVVRMEWGDFLFGRIIFPLLPVAAIASWIGALIVVGRGYPRHVVPSSATT